jgi:hypothetical protein
MPGSNIQLCTELTFFLHWSLEWIQGNILLAYEHTNTPHVINPICINKSTLCKLCLVPAMNDAMMSETFISDWFCEKPNPTIVLTFSLHHCFDQEHT